VLRRLSTGLATCFALATASVAQAPSFGTSVAECRGQYDYAGLLSPNPDGLGLDTQGVTVFGAPVTLFTSEYSNEWDEERFVYSTWVALDYPALRQRAMKAHGASACTEESLEPDARSCLISIPKPKSEFYSVTLQIKEDGPTAIATCVLNLAS
jgi:hypothetical protein